MKEYVRRCAFAITTTLAIFALLSLPAVSSRAQNYPEPLATSSFSGSSNGDPVFRLVDDVSLSRTGLSGFMLHFRGEARQVGTISTGFFDAYRNRITPRLEVLFSKTAGGQAFDWSVTRQALPHRPYFGQRVFEVRGTVPKGAGTAWIPLYFTPGSGHPVLQGFSLQVVGEARRVEEVGVELVPGRFYPTYWLSVTLRQKASFAFTYRVQFTTVMDAFVRSRGESTFLGRGAGSAFVGDRGLLNPALQGFRLHFSDGRHQLQRLAVQVDTEYVTAWLADGGFDDFFVASVDWIDFSDP